MCKLDLSGVRIYSNTKDDIVDAIDLIGEEVYLSDWADFNPYTKDKLISVICTEDVNCPFFRKAGSQSKCGYRYFILAKDVKFVEEKKLRPFTSTYEFTQVTGCDIGDVITIRRIDGTFEESCIVNGYRYCLNTDPSKPGTVYMTLGAFRYSLQELLLYFEYRKDDEWYPFGVEE